MTFKRIIGLLAVRDGRLVKSYGYARWRPAGGLVTALRNLDRWGADEIMVIDISRRPYLDLGVLKQIKAARISTPLGYGGGIRKADDLSALMEAGCDRFILETILFENPQAVLRLADLVGSQALIASVPLLTPEDGASIWRPDGRNNFAECRERLVSLPVCEYFVTAVKAEGRAGAFPLCLLDVFAHFPPRSVLSFGGHDTATALAALARPETAGVVIGNINSERELALPNLRESALVAGLPVRSFRLN